MNRVIKFLATRKLFLQLFSKSEKIFSTCLFSQNILTLTIESRKDMELTMPLKIKLILTTLIERSIERSFTMNNNDINQSYTQAFFTIIFGGIQNEQ